MDKLKRKINHLLIIILLVSFFSACEKETDRPPLASLDPNSIITIDSLRNIYYHYGQDMTFNDDFFQDAEKNPTEVEEYNIYAVVTMSQESGNIYRQAYIEDETGAINVRLTRTNLNQGDSIRINLKGTKVSSFSGMLQLDSVDSFEHVVRLKGGVNFPPAEISIPDIEAGNYQARLIRLNDVQFKESDLGSTFADAAGLNTVNRTLEDCLGNSIIVRTSGYADFANELVPEGKGSLVAVVGLFSPEWQGYDTWQLYIRNYHEIEMDGARCGEIDGVLIFSENFSNGQIGNPIDFNGWKSHIVAGTRHWVTSTTGARNYAQISPFGSGDASNVVWLTSPSVNAQNYQNTALSFESAYANFQHDGLKVFVSYDYSGDNPESATWTELTANIASSGVSQDAWVGSGSLEIENNKQNFHVGFKYTGSDNDGLNTLFRVDNVSVYGIE